MVAPLAGKCVVVTQAAHQAPELAALLEGCGAIPLLYPCIAIEPPQDTHELDSALAAVAAGRYDWVVLTSANTVRVLSERCRMLGLPPSIWTGMRLAAIGKATNEAAVALLQRAADLVAAEHVAEGLANVLVKAVSRGQRLLLPQADIARPVLAQSLVAAGLDVLPLTAYCTVIGSGGIDLPALLAAQTQHVGLPEAPTAGYRPDRNMQGANTATVDAITFTSSSTVHNLLRRFANEGGDRGLLDGICLAAIGPVTADTLRAAGLAPAVVAQDQSLEGLVQALVEHWKQ